MPAHFLPIHAAADKLQKMSGLKRTPRFAVEVRAGHDQRLLIAGFGPERIVGDAGADKPVARAAVQYYPQQAGNPEFRRGVITGWQGTEVSKADGTFQITVLPGPGHLLVMGQDGRYIHEEIGNNLLYSGQRGGTRYYPDAVVKLDLPVQAGPKEIAVALRRGMTLKGRLLGPAGQAMSSAVEGPAILKVPVGDRRTV